jgi:hypothetical protein
MVGVEITIIRAKNNKTKYKLLIKLNPMPNYCLLAVSKSAIKPNIMIPNILLSANIIILIFGIYFIIYKNKVTKDKFIHTLIDNVNLENINLDNCFSKEVIDVYIDVLKNTNDWQLGNCVLENKKNRKSIWIANDIQNRAFYTQCDEIKKELELINNSLTKFDKILLEKIAISYKNRENGLVTRFFL